MNSSVRRWASSGANPNATCPHGSLYDKELKKTRKITGRYLSMITEDKGLVPPRRKQVEIENEAVSHSVEKGQIPVPDPKVGQVKEYGLSAFISGQCTDMTENLKQAMPRMWNRVLAMAYCRLHNQSPLKYIQEDFADSYHRLLPGNVKDITSFLTSVDKSGDTSMTIIGDKGFFSKTILPN